MTPAPAPVDDRPRTKPAPALRPARGPDRATMADLRDRWRRWSAVVALFVRRRRARRDVDPDIYAELHARLVEVCRAAAKASSPGRARYFQNIEELIQPWQTTAMLLRADRTALSLLQERCQRVDRELAGRAHALGLVARALVLAATASGAVALALRARPIAGVALPMLEGAHTRLLAAWYAVEHASSMYKLGMAVVVVMIGGSFLVHRTSQS